MTLSWSTSVKLRAAACWPWRTTLTSRGWRRSAKCSACWNTFPVSLTVWCYCVGKRITVSLQLPHPAKKSKTLQRYRELSVCYSWQNVSLFVESEDAFLSPLCLWYQKGLYVLMWSAGQLWGVDAGQCVCARVCVLGDGTKDRERLCLLTLGGSRWLSVVGLAWTQGSGGARLAPGKGWKSSVCPQPAYTCSISVEAVWPTWNL